MELRRRIRVLSIVLSFVVLAACKGKAQPAPEAASLPVVTDSSTDLLFTWIDEKGEFHVEQRVTDVPASARDVVRVVDPSKDPPHEDLVVADLRNATGGAYPVRTMSRAEFDKIAVDRRKEKGTVLAERAAASALPADTRPTVVIYGASWCGPCHQAADYLKQRGVAFVQKDIEVDGSAAREMQAKLASAGIRGGSIPVIDVRGKLLVGFDPRSVDAALGSAL